MYTYNSVWVVMRLISTAQKWLRSIDLAIKQKTFFVNLALFLIIHLSKNF